MPYFGSIPLISYTILLFSLFLVSIISPSCEIDYLRDISICPRAGIVNLRYDVSRDAEIWTIDIFFAESIAAKNFRGTFSNNHASL